ncbi:type II toxin-antitoxin system VapC family toxin [Salinarimonas sp. NSM]|uniref:type II toxin-antitoxin system VapC family toxin n=1 Tax=Salinarimonas sp. NSM TaxID=3458003 RepID=UPI0040352B65
MIVVDTSALICVVEGERDADECRHILSAADAIGMSAATLIVASSRGRHAEAYDLVEALGIIVYPVDTEMAREVVEAHLRFGRGNHPARLNFGDCFSYALARRLGLPLLYVGQDFRRTDLPVARA